MTAQLRCQTLRSAIRRSARAAAQADWSPEAHPVQRTERSWRWRYVVDAELRAGEGHGDRAREQGDEQSDRPECSLGEAGPESQIQA